MKVKKIFSIVAVVACAAIVVSGIPGWFKSDSDAEVDNGN